MTLFTGVSLLFSCRREEFDPGHIIYLTVPNSTPKLQQLALRLMMALLSDFINHRKPAEFAIAIFLIPVRALHKM